MEKTKFKLLVLVVVIAIVSMACGFSATTANIKEAYMAKMRRVQKKQLFILKIRFSIVSSPLQMLRTILL